jgi:hypothetical protein
MTFRKTLFAAAAITLPVSLTVPQMAQAAPTSFASVPLEKLCRADGVLDFAFGAKGVSTKRVDGRRPVIVPLDAAFQPFGSADLSYSRYSNILFGASYNVQLGDEAEASAAAKTLAGRFGKNGWFPISEDGEDNGGFYLFSSVEQRGDEPAPNEISLSVSAEGGLLTISCENLSQSQMHADEAMGKMPVGFPKPQYSNYVVPPINFEVGDCADPIKSKAFAEAMDGEGRAAFSANWSHSAYEEDLMDWKVMKLTGSGKIGFEDVMGKRLAVLESPEAEAMLKQSTKVLEDFGNAAEKLAPNDEAGMCRVIYQFMQQTSAALVADPAPSGDIITRHGRLTHAILDKEAARLGVSFTE